MAQEGQVVVNAEKEPTYTFLGDQPQTTRISEKMRYGNHFPAGCDMVVKIGSLPP